MEVKTATADRASLLRKNWFTILEFESQHFRFAGIPGIDFVLPNFPAIWSDGEVVNTTACKPVMRQFDPDSDLRGLLS